MFKAAKFSDLDLLKVGHTIQLVGSVWAGEGKTLVVMQPHHALEDHPDMHELDMTLAEWELFLRQTDLLETEILQQDETGKYIKTIVRKSQRQISQDISWQVFKRDNYRCRYCNAEGPLTVDHLVLWESGGPTTTCNLLCACRRCNKERGNTDYDSWLASPYYAKVSRNLSPETRKANADVAATLASIPRMKHKPSHR